MTSNAPGPGDAAVVQEARQRARASAGDLDEAHRHDVSRPVPPHADHPADAADPARGAGQVELEVHQRPGGDALLGLEEDPSLGDVQGHERPVASVQGAAAAAELGAHARERAPVFARQHRAVLAAALGQVHCGVGRADRSSGVAPSTG